MEKITYKGEQGKIEGFLLSIYSVYNLVVIAMAMDYGWDSWVSVLLMALMAGNWIVYIGKVRNYAFRARFSAIIMQISLILYAIQLKDLSRALPIFLAFVVFLGLYGIADIIYITVFSAIIIFICNGVVQNNILNASVQENMNLLMQLGNVFLLEYVVYLWTKRNSEGSNQLLGVIEELRGVQHSKDDFMANVSHEIRTPINTICGISELVLQEELPEKIQGNIVDIQLAGRNLMAVVSDMLDFSELQSGKIEIEEEAYNIASTINDVINMTIARKEEKKLELIVDCNANIPCALLGDEKKIRRVIMKLVDNAIKFTKEGCVSISVNYRKESYGINLIVTVKDTGIGMEEASLEKLFTSFSQVDTGRNRNEGGIGLGLAISHALVKKMGGAITVRSDLGKGSVVQFVIPQKVLDERPIASIEDKENINVAIYIDMEQFNMMAIRDEYSGSIRHMMEQLKGKSHFCRNFAELQRRAEKEQFSHVFISIVEYRQEKEYFDSLTQKMKVIVVLDRQDEKDVTNPQILKIYKPFYILTIVSVLNSLEGGHGETQFISGGKFVTEDVHVLAVDDNRMNLRVIRGFLEEYKIKVTMATSGHEALEKITTEDYDFVFMDHMMPEMDGVETLHRIRHKVGSYYQKVPIVALTANAVAGTREMMLAEGFSDFLEKPIERSVLERVLKRNVSSKKIVFQENGHDPGQEEREKENKNFAIKEELKERALNQLKGQEKEQTQEKGTLDNKNEVKIPSVDELESMLEPKGLEVQKGILYCNGIERYIDILQGYCEECDNSGMLADELFEKQDWKNYVIAVHGMKSAMRSIGAIKISELARKLEYAGKEGKTGYILDNHRELMEEYEKLFLDLREFDWIVAGKEDNAQKKEQDDKVNENLPVLTDSEFEQIIADMEDAMYVLDGDRLLEMVTDLEMYQYCKTALKNVLGPVKRKVEMSDYVSAVELMAKLKSSLARGDGK